MTVLQAHRRPDTELVGVPQKAAPAPALHRADRLFFLDVLRGVAILMVLGQHTPAVLRIHPAADAVSDYFHKNGYLGVDLFFVLSGYLIGGLLFAELAGRGTIAVRRFLLRRAFKIWPAYLICLTTMCVTMGLIGRNQAGEPISLSAVFAAMWPAYFHVQNYCQSTNLFVWFWSLGVEEHFYLLLPAALLFIYPRGGGRYALRRVVGLWLVIAIACLGLRSLAQARNPVLGGYTHYFPTHLRIDGLMLGVLLAAIARYAPAVFVMLRPWRWLLALVAVAAFLLPGEFPGQKTDGLYPFDCTLMSIGAACAVLLAALADQQRSPENDCRQVPGRRAWPWRFLAFIGFYSYSIYLWHGYFGTAITKRLMDAARLPVGGTGVSTIAHLAVYLSVAVALGFVSHFLIERPFLAIRDRIVPSRRPTTLALKGVA